MKVPLTFGQGSSRVKREEGVIIGTRVRSDHWDLMSFLIRMMLTSPLMLLRKSFKSPVILSTIKRLLATSSTSSRRVTTCVESAGTLSGPPCVYLEGFLASVWWSVSSGQGCGLGSTSHGQGAALTSSRVSTQR